ncbi:hypothetical protein DJ93_5495 [Bacillus clarus]|uniref:Uncharacterized protein n=1 Tax=Bacillus clarus TaxID=2338372 RepID=A0A090YC16_9BACI|nr:hypothetical protein DJ93_5495 [Bacillus clarus]
MLVVSLAVADVSGGFHGVGASTKKQYKSYKFKLGKCKQLTLQIQSYQRKIPIM